MAVDPFAEWYSRPLDVEDVLAGGSLILLTAVFLALYLLVVAVFAGAEKEIIGFRFLISMAVADILCMIQYAFVTGVAILTKSRLVSVEGRQWVQFCTDYNWFAFCFHLPLIAWSRLLAIHSPVSFRLQTRQISYTLCLLIGWIAPLILKCATHFQPFMTTFYYEPAVYGMVNDNFPKFISDGHSQLFLVVNSIAGLLPFLFYGIATYLLLQHKITLAGAGNRLMNIERKLILPCALSSVTYILAQAALLRGTGSGKWSVWLICLLFFINSAIQPLLLIAFSPFVRNGVYRIAMRFLGLHSPDARNTAASLTLATRK